MNPFVRKQLIVFTARAAIVILLSALANGFLVNRIRSQQNEIEAKKIVIAGLSIQEDKLAELKKEHEDVVAARFILEDSLLPRLDPRPIRTKILGLVEETGNKGTFTLLSDAASPTEYPGIYTVSFSLELEGSKKSLDAFFDGLRVFDHFLVVHTVSIRGNPDVGDHIKTSFNALIYLSDK